MTAAARPSSKDVSSPLVGAAATRRSGPAAPGPFDLLADPALPQLGSALDPEGMAARFDAAIAERDPARPVEVRGCVVEEVYHRPGHSCGVLYRVRLRGPEGRASEEWFHGRLLPRERLHARHSKALGPRLPNVLAPVSLWEDLGMILWAFPVDPRLPGLARMADRERVGRRFARTRSVAARVVRHAEAASRWRADFERVKYMPGKRCVLRYRVSPEPVQGNAVGSLTFYAKAYGDRAAADAFRRQRAAWFALRAAGTPLEIPEPLAHLAGERVLWLEDWGGCGLIDAAVEEGWDAMADRAAAALAALHLTRIPDLAAAPGPSDVLDGACERGAKYASWVPAQRELVADVLSRLESRRPDPLPAGSRVAVHGEFRAEHVLVRDGRTALLDLDELAEGDPLMDAAEFVAWLEFFWLSREQPGVEPARISRRFLAHYAERVPWPVGGDRLGWYVLAALVRRLHGAVRRLAWPALERLERSGAELVERWSTVGSWVHGGRAPARLARLRQRSPR